MFTHKHHTDISDLACASQLLGAPDAIYPQFATHNAATAAAILQMAAKSGAAFEPQRLHGMGERVYAEVLKNPLVACRVYASVGAHKDLLAYLVRRLLENGANSSFVHQLAELDAKLAASALSIIATCYKTWSKTTVTERASILCHAADALQAELPRFCDLLVKEAGKTRNDAVGEVREAVDFLRYYAWQAERIMQPQIMPGQEGDTLLGVTGESNQLRLGLYQFRRSG